MKSEHCHDDNWSHTHTMFYYFLVLETMTSHPQASIPSAGWRVLGGHTLCRAWILLNYFEAAVLGQSRNSSRKILLGRPGKLQTNTKHGERWDNYSKWFSYGGREHPWLQKVWLVSAPHFLSGWIASLFAVTWTQPCRPTGASLLPWPWSDWWSPGDDHDESVCSSTEKSVGDERSPLCAAEISNICYNPDAKGSFRIPCRCQHCVFVAKFGLMRKYVINFTMVGKFCFGTGMNCYVWFPGFWSMPLSCPTYSWQHFQGLLYFATDLRLPLMGGLYKLVLQWLWLMRRGSTEVRFLIGEFPTLFGTDLGERLQLWARWGGFLQSSAFEWWAWRYGSLCPIRCFFSTVSLRTSASNGPWDWFAVRFVEWRKLVECLNVSQLVADMFQKMAMFLLKATNRPWDSLYVHQMQVHRRARCSLPGKVAGCWCGRWGPITNQRLLDLLPAHQPSISTWCALAEVDPPRNKYSGQGRQL